jgi:hypothetical protein
LLEPTALVVGAATPILAFPQTGEGDARTDGLIRRSNKKQNRRIYPSEQQNNTMNRKKFLQSLSLLGLSGIAMNMNVLSQISGKLSNSERMPVLFLGHGCWSVVKHLYPEAEVPVIQLSLDRGKGPQYHYDLAKELASLRNKGVLIVGSGNMVHNLRMVAWDRLNDVEYGYDWTL